tara:strand:+ start:553 stop:801 length:249 start_codon:yes stop_codon:yes gene_type:complete
MFPYLKKDFESSKVNSIENKNNKNELLKDAKFSLSKLNCPLPESANKVELSSEIKFSAFWMEFSALVAELDALATEIKALDD